MNNKNIFDFSAPYCAYIIITLVCAVFIGCKETKNETPEESLLIDSIGPDSMGELLLFDEPKVPESVDNNFDDFLYTFINDDEFLQERVNFPLIVDDRGKEQQIEKKRWKEADVFTNQDLLAFVYSNDHDLLLLKNDTINDVKLEWIDFEDMSVDEYLFNRSRQWKLVKCVKKEKVDEKYAEFVEFYINFINDIDFQHKAVQTPLTVVTLSHGEMDEGGTQKLSLSEWDELHQQIPMPQPKLVIMDYNHDISDNGNINLLVRSVAEPLYATYKFKKNAKSWKLYEIEL